MAGEERRQVGLARAAGVEQVVVDPQVARREEGIAEDLEHLLEKHARDAVLEERAGGGRQPRVPATNCAEVSHARGVQGVAGRGGCGAGVKVGIVCGGV